MFTKKDKSPEIHSAFKSSIDSNTIDSLKIDLEEYSTLSKSISTLDKIGFQNSITTRKLKHRFAKIENAEKRNLLSEEILKIQALYPNYRMIGFKKTVELCEKYNLYLSSAELFIGSIPNKNAKEIEEYVQTMSSNKNVTCLKTYDINDLISGNMWTSYTPSLFIAARRSDFATHPYMIQIGRTLQMVEKPQFELKFNINMPNLDPDPIILSPIKVGKTFVFHIVSAWGTEADDDYVTPKIKNESSLN